MTAGPSDAAGGRLAVVVHRRSGSGQDDLQPALGILRDAGLDFYVAHCDDIDAILRRTAEAAMAGGTVVIGGGDGTLNAVLPVLLQHGCRLGILPLGTANDLARSLRIPFELEAAARVIAAGRTRRIDIGTVNGRPFFNAASIGFPAEVAKRHAGDRKRRLGLANYPLCWLEALRDFHPPRMTLICGTEAHRHRFMLLTVANGRHHGGGLTVGEAAEIDDGQLRVYGLKPVTLLELLRAFYALRMGRLRQEERAMVMSCETAEVRTRRPLPINVDGEVLERTPARFAQLRGALTVLAPPPGAEDS